MENGCGNYEQESLVMELNQGVALAKQLKAQMSSEILTGETKGMLAERIHSCLEKALLILRLGGSMEQFHQHLVPSTTAPESPLSVIGSPKSEDLNPGIHVQQDGREPSRKRKMMPTWTDQVRACSENAAEGPPEDGYSWRKYGQKDILGAKHPRSYYRCTYRNIQGCYATKQVQRDDEDPMQFKVTYKGTHTCTLAPRSKSAPTSPQKQERNKQNNFSITHYQQPPDMLLNFQTGLRVDIQNLENQETGFFFPTRDFGYENHAFTPSTVNNSHPSNSFPQSFIQSPATSESTYFSTSPCKVSTFGGLNYGQHFESDITEIISATTSGTNSPIIGIDYSMDPWEGFLSDNQAFPNSFSQAKE
ncbi:probable WRKY transcription factor 41 [Chenopodium quinoa]|uniref:probable WRKY transcription factor 41 n=1 Tax=Chenopodium quinoa TaxID=63459 RepID=UPI000B78B109|nr:probable WRKY transcription factor 41 [Chenopodium quinoa]